MPQTGCCQLPTSLYPWGRAITAYRSSWALWGQRRSQRQPAITRFNSGCSPVGSPALPALFGWHGIAHHWYCQARLSFGLWYPIYYDFRHDDTIMIVPNPFNEVLHILRIQAPKTKMAFAWTIISPDREISINSLSSRGKWRATDTLVISRIDFRHDNCKWKQIKQSGRQPKCSSWSVFIRPSKSRNLVAELCQMIGLRCRTILPPETLVSQ